VSKFLSASRQKTGNTTANSKPALTKANTIEEQTWEEINRALVSPGNSIHSQPLTPAAILQLQRTIGNRATSNFLRLHQQPTAAHTKPVLQRDRYSRDDAPTQSPPENKTDSPQDKQKRLEELKDKVKALIKSGRDAGYDLAADNLQYWYDGKGGVRTISANYFSKEAFILEWLRGLPFSKFKEGAIRRIGEGQTNFEMTWKDSIYSPVGHKLFYALGGFTILSKVTAKAEKLSPEEGKVWIVKFENWTCTVNDDYNWDPGKHTFIPGFGDIPDADLRLLEENGFGKSYKIQSDSWIVNDFYLSGFDFPY
jgi:hypothetical protein